MTVWDSPMGPGSTPGLGASMGAMLPGLTGAPAGMAAPTPVAGGRGVIGSVASAMKTMLLSMQAMAQSAKSVAASLNSASSNLRRAQGGGNGGLPPSNSMGLYQGSFGGGNMAGVTRAQAMIDGGVAAAAGLGRAALGVAQMGTAFVPSNASLMSYNRALFQVGLVNGGTYNSNGARLASMYGGLGTSSTDAITAAGAFSSYGVGSMSGAGAGLMRTAGAASLLMGTTLTQAASTIGANQGNPTTANRLRMLGISFFGANGDPGMIADKLWDRFNYSGKNPTLVQRDLSQAGYAGYNNLEYYIPDAGLREQVRAFMIAKASNGGRSVQSAADVARLGGTSLQADAAMRRYAGSETNILSTVGSTQTGAVSAAYGGAAAANNFAAGPGGAALKATAALGGGYEALQTTNLGQAAAGASNALGGLTDAAKSLATMFLMMGGAGGASSLTGLIGRGGAAAAGGAGAVGGGASAGAALGMGAAGVAGIGATEALRAHFADNKTVGNGTGWQKAGTIAGYAGSGALIGAGIGSVVPVVGTAIGAVAGTVIGGAIGGWRAFSGGAAATGDGGGTAGKAGSKTGGATGSAIVNYARNFVGTRYVWGGTTPKGWDCSGFVGYVFRHFGINLPRTSKQQAQVGQAVSMANAQAGDLIFFGNPVHHVAIYIGNGQMVHAANHRLGTIVSKVWSGISGVRRVIKGGLGSGKGGDSSNSNSNSITTPASTSMTAGLYSTATSISQGADGFSASLGSISDIMGVSRAEDTSTSASSGSVSTGDSAAASNGAASGSNNLYDAIKSVGFSGSLAQTMYAIGMAESGGRPGAVGSLNRNGSRDYGWFQINNKAWFGTKLPDGTIINSTSMLNGHENAVAAKYVYDHQGLSAWSTYNSGSYKKYLAGAPSYAKGSWQLSEDQVANVHKDEMILPAAIANAVRSAVTTGATSSSQGGYGDVTIQVMLRNGSDSEVMMVGTKLKKVLSGEANLDSLRNN